LQDVTPDLAQVFGLPEPRGFIVTGFDANSSAQAAGMQPGDILLRFGGLKPFDARALLRGVVILPIHQSFPAVIWRNGKEITLEVQVVPWPNLRVERGTIWANPTSSEQAGGVPLGVSLGTVTDDVRRKYALKNGGAMVTAVDPQSEAHDREITPGDVILRVNNDAIVAPEQAMTMFDKARTQRQLVALLVQDPSGARWITLNLGGDHAGGRTKVTPQAGGEPVAGERKR
jgi:serine protease Do